MNAQNFTNTEYKEPAKQLFSMCVASIVFKTIFPDHPACEFLVTSADGLQGDSKDYLQELIENPPVKTVDAFRHLVQVKYNTLPSGSSGPKRKLNNLKTRFESHEKNPDKSPVSHEKMCDTLTEYGYIAACFGWWIIPPSD